MTAWFHPIRMLRTAFEVMFARAIHTYLDRREVQAHREDPRGLAGAPEDADFDLHVLDLTDRKEGVWIDYVADLGDGFNPTYAVASLLARRSLKLDGWKEELPRADVLVMGGDNVYPTPARNHYERRTLQPYGAALPDLKAGDERPVLVTIPGNHDWYDGLTNFLYYFCRRRSLGAWRTVQSRSYFAIKLPGNWSLWGNDIALSNRIDAVQLSYFERVAAAIRRRNEASAKAQGSHRSPVEERLILCTASPGWLKDAKVSREDHRNFWFFESQCVGRHCVPWVSLAGDVHAYARWSSPNGRQRVVSGSGGSYRRGTAQLAREVTEPPRGRDYTRGYPKGWKPKTFSREGTSYPDDETSHRLARGALAFPLRRHNWPFCLLLGLVLALLAWSLQPYGATLPGTEGTIPTIPSSPSKSSDSKVSQDQPAKSETGLADDLADGLRPVPLPRAVKELPDSFLDSFGRRFVPLGSFWGNVFDEMGTTPATWILPAGVFFAFGLFGFYANERRPRSALVWGCLHGLAHLVGALLLMWLLGKAFNEVATDVDELERVAYYVSLVVVGGLASGALMGLYLVVSERVFGWHDNEVFSCQSIEDYASFLRLHLDKNGELTIYPIGVTRVPRRWTPRLEPRPGESSLEPVDDELKAHLIEGPVAIRSPSGA